MGRQTELPSLYNADFLGLSEKELGSAVLQPKEGAGTLAIRKIHT